MAQEAREALADPAVPVDREGLGLPKNRVGREARANRLGPPAADWETAPDRGRRLRREGCLRLLPLPPPA
ncbi:MAG: hypothetical protein AB1441_00520 [Bacillota bacterium]